MKLKYKYTTYRGLLISEEQIESFLTIINKTEEEVANFLGDEMMNTPGVAYKFLDLFASQVTWYKKLNQE